MTLMVMPNVDPLVRELFNLANKQGATTKSIAQSVGIAEGTVKHWQHGRVPGVSNLQAAFNALGYEMTVRPRSR
jgi:transcriptional regulator with XRE-family HTH domain